jgi:hypothetical protein
MAVALKVKMSRRMPVLGRGLAVYRSRTLLNTRLGVFVAGCPSVRLEGMVKNEAEHSVRMGLLDKCVVDVMFVVYVQSKRVKRQIQ